MLLNKDLFLLRIIDSISKWYDEYYFADTFELERKKEFHVQIMKDNYNHWRFIACENLSEERKKFLGEIQEIVDNEYQQY